MSEYLSYDLVRKILKEQKIGNNQSYRKFAEVHPAIPLNPQQVYADEWKGWHIYLGRRYSFQEALEKVRELKIENPEEYEFAAKEDRCLSRNPEAFYKDEWAGWEDFLGIEQPEYYETFEEAKAAARKLNCKSKRHYRLLRKLDPRLPPQPKKTYLGKGYTNIYDFLGLREYYQTYEEAKAAAQRLNITRTIDYFIKRKMDPKLPSTPQKFYEKKGWKGFSDFLGQEAYQPKKNFYTFEEAKEAVKKLDISRAADYLKEYKKDPMLPSCPNIVYRDKGWAGFKDFLGLS